MKYLYIITLTVLSLTVLGQNNLGKDQLYNDLQKKYKELINENENKDALWNLHFPKSLISNKKLEKSVTLDEEKTHQLDSLLVEKWNKETNKTTIYQLEKWTWFENNLAKSWELYNYNDSTGEWNYNDREEYTYDDNGNKIIHLDFDPIPNSNAWQKNARELNTYNNLMLMTQKDFEYLNHDTDEWELVAKYTYEYNTNQNKTLELHTIWDSTTQKMINYYKQDFVFNNMEECTYMGMCEWNTETQVWDTLLHNKATYEGDQLVESKSVLNVPGYYSQNKTRYTYNDSGEITEVVKYSKTDPAMEYLSNKKETYSYNSNQMERSVFLWDIIANKWLPSYRIAYQYNNFGNAISLQRWDYNDSLDVYACCWKNSYEYDDENRLVYRENNVWNSLDSIWNNDYERNFSFDENGNPLNENELNWDTLTNAFVVTSKEEYIYDLNSDFSQIVYPADYEYWHISNLKYCDQYNNMMLSKKSFEQINGNLEIDESYNFYYSELKTSKTETYSSSNTCVFPNPAKNQVTINTNKETGNSVFELYDLLGNKKLHQKLNGTNTVNISTINAGTYFYRIRNTNEISKGKLIVM